MEDLPASAPRSTEDPMEEQPAAAPTSTEAAARSLAGLTAPAPSFSATAALAVRSRVFPQNDRLVDARRAETPENELQNARRS